MQNKSSTNSDVQLDLHEAIELIEISRKLFQEKLKAIKIKSAEEKDLKKKGDLEKQAKDLYEDYKRSLAEIENFINEVAKTINN